MKLSEEGTKLETPGAEISVLLSGYCTARCVSVPAGAEKLVHIAANKLFQSNLGDFMAPADDL
jgi:hypothetical protein